MRHGIPGELHKFFLFYFFNTNQFQVSYVNEKELVRNPGNLYNVVEKTQRAALIADQ